MVVAGMQAGGKGVQPLQAMRQPMFHQKFQGAIGHWRLPAKSLSRQAVQNLIGTHGPVRFQQDFKGPPPDGGQPRAVFGQTVAGLVKRARFAGQVVVGGKGGSWMDSVIGQFVTLSHL